MMKTFRKLWSIVDISVDLLVDVFQAIRRELKDDSSLTEAVQVVNTDLAAKLAELQNPATTDERKNEIISSLSKK